MTALNIGDAITVGIGFGSIGCCLRPNSDKEKGIYILTNGHVIADGAASINIGTKVYLGRAQDGSTLTQKVAGLTQVATVYKGLREFNHSYGYVDWALCKVLPTITVDVQNIIGDNLITKFAAPDETVTKRGARTGTTNATIQTLDYREQVDYLPNYPANVPAGKGLLEFQGHDFVAGGDSGSIAVDRESNKVVALLFAGDQFISTFGIDIRRILKSLEDKTKMTWDLAPSGIYLNGDLQR